MNQAIFTTVLFTFIFSGLAFGQQAAKKSLFDFLSEKEALEVNFTADFSKLKEEKFSEEYAAGNLFFKFGNGRKMNLDVKVRPRGKFRRRVCEFPPLKLKFSKKDLTVIGLDTFNNYKLVTHCSEAPDAEESLLKEYAAYKILNQLTDKSFHVKLLKINYIDLHDSNRNMTKYGFIMEDEEEIAQRLGGAVCDCYNVPFEKMDTLQADIAAMFNYMIGNPDWDVKMVRNILLVKQTDQERFIQVPYDFDFSGIVSPAYLRKNQIQNRANVFDKVQESNPSIVSRRAQLKNYFATKKEEIFSACRELDPLPKSTQKAMVRYLESFFEELESSDNVRILRDYNTPLAQPVRDTH